MGFLTLISYGSEISPVLDDGIILIQLIPVHYYCFFDFVLKSLAYFSLSVLESRAFNMKTLQEVKSFLPLPFSSIERDIMPSGFFCICSVQSDSQISFLNMRVMPLAVWPHTGKLLEVVWKPQFGINAEPNRRYHKSFPRFFLLLLFKVIAIKHWFPHSVTYFHFIKMYLK